VHLQTFVPFLPFLYARCSRTSSLWIAAFCGLLLDLLGSHRLGAHLLAFSLATLLFYGQKKHFYEDKPLALCLFTWILSFFLTGILFLFTFFADAPPLRWEWAVVDFIAMPCVDALYALVYFSCPMGIYAYVQKGGLRRFLHRLRRNKRDMNEA
jgi:rod shape-determining protein MreD